MDEQQHNHDEAERTKRSTESAAAARIQHQTQWVEQQLRVAHERGDFDDLPGAGKPLTGLGTEHDPDWWLKKLVEREQLSVLPPALALRKEDAELEQRLDAITAESEVRREVEEFNERVLKARYTALDGPPLITMPRDVDETVAKWRERQRARTQAQRATRAQEPSQTPRRGWLRRRTR